MDFFCTGASIEITCSNQTAIPVIGRLWRAVSRYDQAFDPASAYTTSKASDGRTGSSIFPGGSINTVDSSLMSTPFNYTVLLQMFKIESGQKFKLMPGESRTFRFSLSRFLHITYRLSGINSVRNLTRWFWFNFYGQPLNDNTTKTNVSSGYGDVDVVYTVNHDYEIRPVAYHYADYTNSMPSIAVPSILEVNNPTASTSIAVA